MKGVPRIDRQGSHKRINVSKVQVLSHGEYRLLPSNTEQKGFYVNQMEEICSNER